MLDFFIDNQNEIITTVIIMVSAVIVFMGILKGILFNRIKSKSIRCVALSFSSLAIMFAVVAVYFFIHGLDFKYFLPCGAVVNVIMIVVYWLYENTQLRTGIHKIGSFVVKMIFNRFASKVNEVASGTEVIGSSLETMLKKNETKTSGKKDDLKNL